MAAVSDDPVTCLGPAPEALNKSDLASRRHAPTTGLAEERPNDVAYSPNQGDDKTGELGAVATDVLWLDLLNPTSAEVTNVEETVGATLPSLGALSEIETSAASKTTVVSST